MRRLAHLAHFLRSTAGVLVLTFAYTPFASIGAPAQGHSSTLRFEYDANGNPTKVTGALNHATDFYYDALNRLSRELRPVPMPNTLRPGIRYGYDGRDNTTSVVDPRSVTTNYSVDGMDERRRVLSPDAGDGTLTYDAAGNLKTSTDARGIVTSYSYDALNRLTAISFGSGPRVYFEYDKGGGGAIGRLSRMTDESGSTSYTYTPFGELASKTQAVAAGGRELQFLVVYSYISNGSLASMTYPSGNRLNYGYDAAGELSSITLNPATGTGFSDGAEAVELLTAIRHMPFGPVQSWVWGNSTPTRPNGYARTFDWDGRVTSVTLGNPSAGGTVRTIEYDEAGRIRAFRHGGDSSLDQSFDYDALDRVTGFSTARTRQTYQYDANGNRTGASFDAKSYANVIDAASNRLMSSSGPVPGSNRYDATGNLVSNGSITYSYSNRGRITSATAGSVTTSYLYNGLGQRVLRNSSAENAGDADLFVYDEQGNLIGEYDSATGRAVREIVYLGELPVAIVQLSATGNAPDQIQEMKLFHVYPDHLGTPRLVTRAADNAVVWRWDGSDPFGLEAPNENPSGLGRFTFNLRMPGQYHDRETGLFYNGNRTYDPATGRYIESDPLGLDGGLNLYSYAEGNPLSKYDQSGLSPNSQFGGLSGMDFGGLGNPGISCSGPGGFCQTICKRIRRNLVHIIVCAVCYANDKRPPPPPPKPPIPTRPAPKDPKTPPPGPKK